MDCNFLLRPTSGAALDRYVPLIASSSRYNVVAVVNVAAVVASNGDVEVEFVV
jgi:hypothetical protein